MDLHIPNSWLIKRSDELRFTHPESVDADDVHVARSVARELHRIGNDHRLQTLTVPPPELRRRLRVVGRFFYEVAWRVLDSAHLPASWGTAFAEGSDGHRLALAQVELLEQLDQAARILPWREYAPRALGAIRSKGLAASKQNDRQGYLDAWSFHFEGEEMYKDFREMLHKVEDPELRSFSFELDSVRQQLLLAETGTSCRQAERTFALHETSSIDSDRDELEVFDDVFSALEDGAVSGRGAIEVLRGVERHYGLVSRADETHLLGPKNFRNAGCMAARAQLLLLPMAAGREHRLRPAPAGFTSWDAYRADLEQDVLDACAVIEREKQEQFRDDHLRQISFIRLSMAFLMPGRRLDTQLNLVRDGEGLRWEFGDLETAVVLDQAAVTRLSQWLIDQEDECGDEGAVARLRGDDGVFGSLDMPAYLEALRRHLIRVGTWERYVEWRSTFPRLDRHRSPERHRAFLAWAAAAGDT